MATKDPKFDEDHARLCDAEGCELPATHTLVWTDKWQCYCIIHANQMLNIADAIGFSTPKLTVRLMNVDEMMPDA